ncbi:MAG: hypothetical protein WD423_14220 [Rhodothermales bacterium]
MHRFLLLVLLVLTCAASAAAQQPDTVSLARITLSGAPIDTTLDLNRAGLTYEATDVLELFDGDGRPPANTAVRLRCATLAACLEDVRAEPGFALPTPGSADPKARWPLRLSVRGDAVPLEYLVEIRDSTGRLRPYRRLRLEPPAPRVTSVTVRQGGQVRADTVLVDLREPLTAQLLLVGGPFYADTRASLAQRPLRTELRGRDTLVVFLTEEAGEVRELVLGARRLRLSHPGVAGGTGPGWDGVGAAFFLKGRRAPRIDRYPAVVNVERGYHEVALQGADFDADAQICALSGTYRLAVEGCLSQTRREGRTLRADVDFGTPRNGFTGGSIRLFVRNGDGRESDEVYVQVRPLDSTADAVTARTGDVVVAGVPTEIIFQRKERSATFPTAGNEDFKLQVGGEQAELFINRSDVNSVRATVTVPESVGGQTPRFDLSVGSDGATWSGTFVPVARRPRLADDQESSLRRGEDARLVFSNGIAGRLVSDTDGVQVVDGELQDGEAVVRVTTARTGSDARFYVHAGGRSIDSLSIAIESWPEPEAVVRIGTEEETARIGARPLVALSTDSPLVIEPLEGVGVRPRVDIVLRKADGSIVSDPIMLDFGQQGGMVLHPDLYGLTGGDRFNVEFRTPDGTIARQQAYVKRPFLDRWSVSAGLSAIEYKLRSPEDESTDRGSTLNGVQIATHYLFEFPRLDKRPFGVGTHVIASESAGRLGVRMAGSVLFFETLAVGVGGWSDPFLFIGANIGFLDLSNLFGSRTGGQ